MPQPISLRSKKKKEKRRKKERVSKKKLLKDCHQGQHVTILTILERLVSLSATRWRTLLVLSCLLHFEIHFAGPVLAGSKLAAGSFYIYLEHLILELVVLHEFLYLRYI